jgi:hypothetical protein
VKGALLTGKALADHFGIFINQNTHFAASTTFCAASVKPAAAIRFKPLLESI